MVRKTISIGPNTWEALSALGRFGQSFDDVIQIILKEREECIRNHRQQPHKYSYSEASGEKQLKQSAFKEEFNLDLPGVKFPVSKTKIIEAARRGHNSKPIINALNRIPDRVYKDGKDLEVPLIQTYKELFAATRGISDVNVVTNHIDKKEHPQQQVKN